MLHGRRLGFQLRSGPRIESREVKMRHRASVLDVREFPGGLNTSQGRLLWREVQGYLYDERPCIVLNFAKVDQMDRPSFLLLLCCLEEAIKRNGDVKLAEVSAEARSALELTGVDRIFEIFDTNAEAINSFRKLSVSAGSHRTVRATLQSES